MTIRRQTAAERLTPALPLLFQWDEATLPRRAVRPPARPKRTLGLEAPPYWTSGPTDKPFDFCGMMKTLCADLAARTPELQTIDVSRLLFGMTQARNGRKHGLQARVTPLRFADGKLHRQRRGVVYQVQRYFVAGREMLYLVTFCLPRFLDQPFEDKFVTLFHELYHIGPQFDGDLRRHKGRYSMHTHSKAEYDVHMADLARRYLASRPDPALFNFLRLDFAQLQHRHGSVVSAVVPHPKLIPVAVRPPQPSPRRST